MRLKIADDLEVEVTEEILNTISEILDSLFLLMDENDFETFVSSSENLKKVYTLIQRLFL